MKTIEERIKDRIQDLKSLEPYFYSDNRSWKFFEENPLNSDALIVNEKISAINSGLIDSTYVPALAQLIVTLPVDKALNDKDLAIVEKMSALPNKPSWLNLNHFCSLYCNYHDRDTFPIHSPTAVELLRLLQSKAYKPENITIDLDDYHGFKKGIDVAAEKYDLTGMNYHEIDKFFWLNATRIKDFIKTL